MTARKPAKATRRAVLFGAGRMGGAMAHGWKRGFTASGLKSLDIVDPSPPESTMALADGRRIRLNAKPRKVDVAIIGVKPQGFEAAAPDFVDWIQPDTIVISVMAGIRIERIASLLGVERVVRAMPNTPGSIGKGITGISMSDACGAVEQTVAEQLLSPLGDVVGPVSESQLDALTAVSGSGPAYVFLLAETLEAAGRAVGLAPELAAKLARSTVAGAGALLAEGEDPAALRKAVTSPGGTTAAALDVLMAPGAMPEIMRKAVESATKRNIELSGPMPKKS